MQLIPTRIHGMLDYLVGALLIAAPWLLDFARGGAETWVPVALGVGAILYSIFTDYELGLVRSIPMPTHLRLDLANGVLLAASPWLFGFADYVWQPHLIVGLIEVGTALMSRRVPADGIHRVSHRSGVGQRTSGAFRS
jgi:hypothetical protein